MKKLFIHDPVFRITGPLFGGSLVYLMILLVNNNVGQLDDQFLGEELYLCIGITYLMQESLRLLLLKIAARYPHGISLRTMIFQSILSMLITTVVVSLSLYGYYKFYLGFPPGYYELLLFNVIYSMLALSYLSLFISHHFLYRINTEKLAIEIDRKNETEAQYRKFIRGINPGLLFESLEALIVQLRSDSESDPDELLDSLSMVYRYMLASRTNEPVVFGKEKEALIYLIELLNLLPYTHIKAEILVSPEQMVLPGTLLQIFQELAKVTIPSAELIVDVLVTHQNGDIVVESKINDRLGVQFSESLIDALNSEYKFYTDRAVRHEVAGRVRRIFIPELTLKP